MGTCDDGQPPLVTHVATTPAPVMDRAALGSVHAAPAEKGFLPGRHLARAVHLDGLSAREQQRPRPWDCTRRPGSERQPVARPRRAGPSCSRTSPSTGTGASPLARRAARAGTGATSRTSAGRRCASASPPRTDKACPSEPRRTRAARRLLTPRPRHEHETLVATRARETDPPIAAVAPPPRRRGHAVLRRVRAMGLRRSRTVGIAETLLQHPVTAAAANLVRLAAWVEDTPGTRTRRSAFAHLMSSPAAPAKGVRQQHRFGGSSSFRSDQGAWRTRRRNRSSPVRPHI